MRRLNDPDSNPAYREALASRVHAVLARDSRVARVTRFGSLAADPDIPDQYSDIDFEVFVAPPTSDLAFLGQAVAILSEVAPVAASAATSLGAFGYVAHVWFEGMPPFWNVDIRCRADCHQEASDFGKANGWSTGYRLWLLAVKKLLRTTAFISELRGNIAGEAGSVRIDPLLAQEMRDLLNQHCLATTQIAEATPLALLCRSVAEAYLKSEGTAEG